MYVFVIGMERCGTHSVVNIIRSACRVSSYVVHEGQPLLCQEAKLIFEGKDFRTESLKEKIKTLQGNHQKCQLVCEANHRLGYFTTLLMREFAPSCKFIFLVRDPLATILSRICTWAHYPDFMDKYPDFYKEEISKLTTPVDFNKYRISPPSYFSNKGLAELYAWEWLENYKFVRRDLACIPRRNRLIMFTEEITDKFNNILNFIGIGYFKVDGEVIGWSQVKSDSVFPQPKERETDVFVTNNRDPNTDKTIIFAKEEMSRCKGLITKMLTDEISKLSDDMDSDLVQMDKYVLGHLKSKVLISNVPIL